MRELAVADRSAPPGRLGVLWPLMAKEWHEQRWRFALGAFVITVLLAALLRAQVIPYTEGALLIYGPVGLVLVIFLAMGPVSSEKAAGTWEFLQSQPVTRADVLTAKWLVGLFGLLGMLAVATAGGLLAMWSRGFYGWLSVTQYTYPGLAEGAPWLAGWSIQHPGVWLAALAGMSAIGLGCWYTILFLILTRARTEFAAAMGGILCSMVVIFWGFNVAPYLQLNPRQHPDPAQLLVMVNPLLLPLMIITPQLQAWLLPKVLLNVLLWVVAPLLLARRLAGKVRRV